MSDDVLPRLQVRVRGATPARQTPARRFWRVFTRNRGAVVSLYALMATSVVGPVAVGLLAINPDAMSSDVLDPPSLRHPMGSDYLGRDVLGRVVHGINTSLLVGAAVALTATAIGLALGTMAGYRGGWLEHAIMRLADALLIIPTFFLVLSIAFVFGGSLVSVVVLLGVTMWPPVARIVRAEVLSLREEAFVLSARALGSSDTKIMFREILPSTLPPGIAMIALLGSAGILTEASLSFLGVGDPNVVSLGQMLTNGLEYTTTAWWVPSFPGAAIFALVLLMNVLGDGLNAALSPRMWGR